MKVRGQTVLDPVERIRRNSEPDEATGCWNWTGAVRPGKRPYGRLGVGSRADGVRRAVSAHRYSYETFVGPIGDLYVCHKCDNPRCVNPAHLFLGTAKDNADDRDRKGRNSPPPISSGETSPNAKLTAEQVAEIRASPETSRAIAPRFKMSDSQIRAIRRGVYYPVTVEEDRA